MNQNPIIKALREELEKERDDEMTAFELCTGPVGYRNGHASATARLLGLLTDAINVIEFYGDAFNYSVDDYHGISGEMHKRCVLYKDCEEINDFYSCAGKKAREFLTTLADASGEMKKDVK